MKFNPLISALISFLFFSLNNCLGKSSSTSGKKEMCPRTARLNYTSQRVMIKYGSRCASINEYELSFKYYMRAIQLSNYDPAVVREILHLLNRMGKNPFARKIISAAIKEKKKKDNSIEGIYNDLTNWAKRYNASVGPIQIKELTKTNRYFVSTRDILKGELLMAIPITICLSSVHPELFPLLREFETHKGLKGFSDTSKLDMAFITYIMKNLNNSKGFFAPFFRSLPASVDEYPDFQILAKPESLRFIKNSNLEKTITHILNSSISQYKAIINIHPELRNFTLKDYVKASDLYISRTFNVMVNGKRMSLMVPIADLINHSRVKRNAHWRFNNQLKRYEIYATFDIKKGDEVFISYGLKDKTQYLIDYGFIPSKDTAEIVMNIQDKDIVREKSSNTQVMLRVNIYGDKVFTGVGQYRKLFKTHQEKSFNSNLPISINNEKLSIKAIIHALSKRLSRYPTALHDDKIQLNNKKLTYLQKNMLRILIEEKTALLNSLKKLSLIAKVLDLYNPGLVNVIQRSHFTGCPGFIKYFNQLREHLNLNIYYN